jgi:shikimate kinase
MNDTRPIALVGLRCVGKSTVGALLARKLELGFVDLDECVKFALQSDCCSSHAPSLAEWIRAHGWEAFREREAEELARLLDDGAARVIATGGGAVERGDNRRRLEQRARVVWLRENLSALVARFLAAPGERPALTDLPPAAEFARIEALRSPLYAEVAAWTVDGRGRSPSAVSDEIVQLFRAPAT